MVGILLAVFFLFGIAVIVSVVRTSLRFQRLQRALARGERTPELEAVIEAARRKAGLRSKAQPPGVFSEDMRKLMAGASELTRQGKFDQAARQRFDREFNAELARWDRELDGRIAEIQAGVSPKPKEWIRFAAVVLIVIGALLHLYVGMHFVSAHGDTLETVSAGLAAVSLPFFAVYWFRMLRTETSVRRHGPLLRWLLLYPAGIVLGGTTLFIFPSGYIAATGWVVGTPSTKEGTVITTREVGSSKRCHRFVSLRIGTGTSEVCTEGMLSDGSLEPGQSVLIEGRASRLGIYVEQIHGNQAR